MIAPDHKNEREKKEMSMLSLLLDFDVRHQTHIIAFRSDHFPNDQKKRPRGGFKINGLTFNVQTESSSYFCVF